LNFIIYHSGFRNVGGGGSDAAEAWATVDTANRLMQGQPFVDQRIPVRLFDKSNIAELTSEDLKDGWQGGIDYKSFYKKMWLVN